MKSACKRIFSLFGTILFFTMAVFFQSVSAEGTVTLTIEDSDTNTDSLFMANNPDISIVHRDYELNAHDNFAQRLQMRDSSVDIYSLYVSDGLSAFKDKGFLTEIDDSTISDLSANWFDSIKSIVCNNNGKVVAVPHYIYVDTWEVNKELIDSLYPDTKFDTWLDILSCYEEYLKNVPKDAHYSEMTYQFILYGIDIRALQTILTTWIENNETAASPVTFDNDELWQTIDKCIELLEPDSSMEDEDEEEWNELVNMPYLFAKNSEAPSSLNGTMDRMPQICPPSILKTDKPSSSGVMKVYVINPYSKHIKEATQYLSCYVSNMSDYDVIKITKGDTPLEYPDWEKRQKSTTDMLEQKKALLKTAEGAEKDMLEFSIESLEKQLKCEDDRYKITREQRINYNQIMDNVSFHQYSNFLGYDNGEAFQELYNIILMYKDGAINRKTATDRMNEIARTVFSLN